MILSNKQIADILTLEAYKSPEVLDPKDLRFTIIIDEIKISCKRDQDSILSLANKFRNPKRDRMLYIPPKRYSIKRPLRFSNRIYISLSDDPSNAKQYKLLYSK